MKYLLINIINIYQRYLSFDTGILRVLTPNGACKHTPSCSEYTKLQILKYGSFKGTLLGLRRILSCW